MIETKDSNAIVDIQYAIDNTLLTLGLNKKEEEWVGQQIINCIREMTGLFHATNMGIKEEIIDIDTNTNTIDMPSDYIDYVMVAQIKDKYIYPFYYNKTIPTIQTMTCGVEGYEYKSTTNIYSNITFSENHRERYIQLSAAPYDNKVYLKYISSGVAINKQYFIPALIVPTLTAYVDWRLSVIATRSNTARSSVYNEQRKGQVYANYVRALQEDKYRLRFSDFLRSMYKNA